MKRFYKQAAVLSDADGFAVALDGKPIRTPGGQRLLLPAEALAAAIAQEWQAQPADREIRPSQMRLMRLAATGIDRVPPQRAKVINDTAKYAGTDLLCYRADAPNDLVLRQHRAWQPVLDWAAERYGVSLMVQAGLLHHPQPDEALHRYREEVARHSNLGLSGLFNLTAACGSLLLCLAIAEGRLGAQAGFEAAEVDALYQAERWGEDPEAAQRRAGVRADIAAAAEFLSLLGSARLTG